MRRSIAVLIAAVGLFANAANSRADFVNFEDIALPTGSYLNGSDGSGGFMSGGARLTNLYNPTYRVSAGWAVSNMTDILTPGYRNQYSAVTGSGVNGSQNYGIGFLGTYSPTLGAASEFHNGLIQLPNGLEPKSVAIANTAYVAHSILSGDQFAKKFGGPTGTDPDWLRLTIRGNTSDGTTVATNEVYLADYRSPTPGGDYVALDWLHVDLATFRGKGVTNLTFSLDSSDVGVYGMNTPGYVAMDNLELVAPSLTRLPGDANGDGRVDSADLALVVSNLGLSSEATWQSGDFNSDGTVSMSDVMLLRSNFGATGGPGSGDPSNPTGGGTGSGPSTVPEPQSLLLILSGAGLLWCFRRRK
jgi:hypothetical protein